MVGVLAVQEGHCDDILLMTVVVGVAVAAVVFKMPKASIMKTPIPTTVLMVMTALMVMIMLVSVMVMMILELWRAALPCPPGSGILFSGGSGVLWIVGRHIIYGTDSGVLSFPPPSLTPTVEALDKSNTTAAVVLVL